MISRIIDTHSSIRTRSVEMFLATAMLLQGLIFLLPGATLELEQWHDLRVWVAIFPGNEELFGGILALAAVLRWTALIINGNWSPTPGIRIIGCMVGSLYWATTSYSFFNATTTMAGMPASLSWSLAALAFETFSAIRAAKDAFTMDTFGQRSRRKVGGRVV